MNKFQRTVTAIVSSPIVWGGLAAFGFYTLIHTEVLEGEFFRRYFTDHWVLYAETIMFFVGVAFLTLKWMSIAAQRQLASQPIFDAPARAEDAAIVVPQLTAALDSLDDAVRNSALVTRLRDALAIVARKGSGDSLDEDLRYLAEEADSKAHSAYALLRFIIWAIPILGFLGTVIGITVAIANLSPEAMEQSLGDVTKGLGVAFDTTALALSLSMALMFGQFVVEKFEGGLLAEVDRRAIEELDGRIERVGAVNDPNVAAVRRMAEAVIKSSERLVERQAELWRASLDAAEERYQRMIEAAGRQLDEALGRSLAQSLERHAARLTEAESANAERSREAFEAVARSLAESAAAIKGQQAELMRQGDIMMKVVETTGQVMRLEETLNSNLSALAGAQHFEETLLNLSATVSLLNARLGQVAPPSATKDLGASSTVGRAA